MENIVPGTARIFQFLALAAMPRSCGTRAVTGSSLSPTREYSFHRMYFRSDLSFSKDARQVCEERKNEGLYRR